MFKIDSPIFLHNIDMLAHQLFLLFKKSMTFWDNPCSLQSNRAKFNQIYVSPTCQLCNKTPETREHFLTSCESLKHIRTEYINTIRSRLEHSSCDINILLDDPASCTQLLLDASHPDIDNILHLTISYIQGSSYSRFTWKGQKS